MNSSSAASRMRVRVSCCGLTARKVIEGIRLKRTFEMLASVGPRRQASVVQCWPPRLVSPFAQRAGRTAPAAMAPRVPRAALPQIASVRLFDDQLDQRLPAQVARQLPGRRLIDPHERGLD